jgi:hypothetical protein
MWAYLPKANGYVIGSLAAHDTNQHHRWNRIDGHATAIRTPPVPAHHLIWVADIYRRYDLGNTLLRALASDFGCQVTNACQAKAGL